MELRVSLTCLPTSDVGSSLRSLTKHSSALFTLASTVRLPGRRTSRYVRLRPTKRSQANPLKYHRPEVSRFYGIVVRFYYRDHPPTHFHAIYGEFEAQIEIETGAINRGPLPKTAYDLVNTWRLIHLQELRDNWNRARQQLPVLPITPLE